MAKKKVKRPLIEIEVETKPCRGVVRCTAKWKNMEKKKWEVRLHFDPEESNLCRLENSSESAYISMPRSEVYISPSDLIAFADAMRDQGYKSSKES